MAITADTSEGIVSLSSPGSCAVSSHAKRKGGSVLWLLSKRDGKSFLVSPIVSFSLSRISIGFLSFGRIKDGVSFSGVFSRSGAFSCDCSFCCTIGSASITASCFAHLLFFKRSQYSRSPVSDISEAKPRQNSSEFEANALGIFFCCFSKLLISSSSLSLSLSFTADILSSLHAFAPWKTRTYASSLLLKSFDAFASVVGSFSVVAANPSGNCRHNAVHLSNAAFPIDGTLFGNESSSKDWHSANALSPILSISLGKLIVFNAEHPLNAPLPITFKLSGMVIICKWVQSEKASYCISLSPSGNSTFDSSEHPLNVPKYSLSITLTMGGITMWRIPLCMNAPPPILVTPRGSVTSESALHPAKAHLSILVTVSGIVIVESIEQSRNKLLLISVSSPFIYMLFSWLHAEKAPVPIDKTDFGMVILDNPVQDIKAHLPIFCNPSGKVTSFMLRQLIKLWFWISEIVSGIIRCSTHSSFKKRLAPFLSGLEFSFSKHTLHQESMLLI